MLWPNGSKTRPTITSGFGPRKAPIAGASTFHRGTDFVGFSAVRAIAAGTVEVAGTPSGWGGGGNQIWIRHADGSLSRYLHLKSFSVGRGARVSEGQQIGIMGATGNVSGVHVHLEIVPAGASAQVDAVPYIQARLGGTSAGFSQEVANQQAFLISRGWKIAHDGIMGPATRQAIKEYQGYLRDNYGYRGAIDGIWGAGTQEAHAKFWAALNAPAPSGKATLRRGSSGAEVRALQQKLKTSYSLYAGRLVVDGQYGPATEAAVREFQRRSGITADGIAGPVTRAKLGV